MAVGALNAAFVPVASAQAAAPEPAMVVTANVVLLIARKRWLPVSTMSRDVAGITPNPLDGELASPEGLKNIAEEPAPST